MLREPARHTYDTNTANRFFGQFRPLTQHRHWCASSALQRVEHQTKQIKEAATVYLFLMYYFSEKLISSLLSLNVSAGIRAWSEIADSRDYLCSSNLEI